MFLQRNNFCHNWQFAYPFGAWCPLKGHIYPSKPATFSLSMCDVF